MKGIILAGGSGSRLYPITKGISKQLIPINDKPMIYYPLSTLMEGNIKEILIISTPEDIESYKRLLGDGSLLGLKISYKVQPSPDGLAQAFILGKEFIGNDSVCLILGDNVFCGKKISNLILDTLHNVENEQKANIFGYKVKDPQRYGVAEFDKKMNILSVEEKPKNPKSNYAIVGLYCYPNDVIEKVDNVVPSDRGELEITSLNDLYLKENLLKIKLLDDDFFWLDTGTHESLIEAGNFVRTIENRENNKIACIEEIAYKNGWISEKQLIENIEKLGDNQYSQYLSRLV
tara:strand:+ start:9565 stop:10434 length:870 start_codon:yes stop_codon:yes gene_type:complete